MQKKLFFLLLFLFNAYFSISQTTVIDSFQYDGNWRNYRLFLPTGFSTSASLPLVLNFHGYGSNALEQEAYSGFNVVADTAQVVMCYPNGLNNSWNIAGSNSFDIGFVDTLITVLNIEYNINLNRVYATGLSNGGFLSNLIGCNLSNRFAAIAPVAGTNILTVQSSCFPSRHVPILYIHGTADSVVIYNGGVGYVSAADLMQHWATINGCSSITDTFPLANISTTDFCTAERITWHNCDSSIEVIHYRIIGGGHTWPGSQFIIGVTNQDFNASGVIWDFFNRHSLNTGIETILSENKISISPNPFNSFIDIELPHPDKSVVKIYSPDGRLINSFEHIESKFRLEGFNLTPGLYFVNIVFENTFETFQVIKSK